MNGNSLKFYIFFLCFIFISFSFFAHWAKADTATVSVTIAVFECSDGADNDSDGLTDYPNDPGCDSLNDDDETDPPADPACGDGSCNGSESCSSCQADCGVCSGGGGGGGFMPPPAPPATKVVFKGKAYPGSMLTLLKDAQVAVKTPASPDANFEISLSDLSAGTYTFGIWAEDSVGRRSVTRTFTISIASGASTVISGIFIPPTISTDKTKVRRGDILNILGQSAPNAQVTVFVNSENEVVEQAIADDDGLWLHKFDTLQIEYGDHSTKSRATSNKDISTFSKAVFFEVGNNNEFREEPEKPVLKGDLNNDGRVNLIDFSIGGFWWKRLLSQDFAEVEAERLNADRKLTLVDFSIMAYYWTG